MKAIVVYESLWGNTETIARSIAEGIGPEVPAMPTDQAPPALVAAADLIVAGSPVFVFSLPTDAIRESIARGEADAPTPPDLSHPSLRSWLESLPHSQGRFAAFETRIWWSPRGATGAIEARLQRAGYTRIAKAQKFVVKDKYGPLRDGESDRARQWGMELAQAMGADRRPLMGAANG